ncbi:MAG TPA: UDP-N-acetylmuramoyl-L-alanyl-D-glutamate--2,6-diaminopimelate ligase [Chloroflexota bacterium]|nr:UDP-N-acetylmuramoyl-L-alanyl-D-glutamate--2,6-diaminopimelate ligase [Chloroflexota bacterium]
MSQTKPLRLLLEECPGAMLVAGSIHTPIGGISHNSRQIKPGWLFVAVPGLEHDGNDFIPAAIRAGAAAIATERPVTVPAGVAMIRVPSARSALADLAASFWDHPSHKLTLIGVTGTDGKTTTVQLIGATLRQAGQSVGWLSTAGIRIGDQTRPNTLDHTTPEAPAIQEMLAEMVEAGVDSAVLEVSSHALALQRVRGCQFDVAVFTNLSPEHLNFHGTLEAYRSAKASLMSMLQPGSGVEPPYAAINLDDPSAEAMIQASRAPVRTYAIKSSADFTATRIEVTPGGSSFMVHTPGGEFRLDTQLVGRFNVENWLAAIAATSGLGVTTEDIQRAARDLGPVRGRMERVDEGQPFLVVVDFAHTPQALETALRTLRPHTRGRLLALFGQAGGRDPANRPAMGALATELADYFLITLDDPIHEDPQAIAGAISAGAIAAGASRGRDFDVELDRAAAIRRLVDRARPGDVILLAGKGHEQRMLVGNEKLPWDDASEARSAIRELKRRPVEREP